MGRLDWETEIRPVLVAAYEALDKAGLNPNVDTDLLLAQLRWQPDERERLDIALTALEAGNYLSGYRAGGSTWDFVTLSERGLVEVAGWPAQPGMDYGAKLLELVDRRIEESDDPDERTKLQRFRGEIASIGRNVVTALLTDLARGGL